MKELLTILLIIFSLNIYSQSNVVIDTAAANAERKKFDYNNPIQDFPRESFIGKWKDENSTFIFYPNGDFEKTWNNGKSIKSKWKWIDQNLYVGLGSKKKFIRFYMLQNDMDFFSYKIEGEEKFYNAERTK